MQNIYEFTISSVPPALRGVIRVSATVIMEDGRRPTAAEVIGKLKDDGDFDTLRLKIIRKVKENVRLLPNLFYNYFFRFELDGVLIWDPSSNFWFFVYDFFLGIEFFAWFLVHCFGLRIFVIGEFVLFVQILEKYEISWIFLSETVQSLDLM